MKKPRKFHCGRPQNYVIFCIILTNYKKKDQYHLKDQDVSFQKIPVFVTISSYKFQNSPLGCIKKYLESIVAVKSHCCRPFWRSEWQFSRARSKSVHWIFSKRLYFLQNKSVGRQLRVIARIRSYDECGKKHRCTLRFTVVRQNVTFHVIRDAYHRWYVYLAIFL